MKIDVGGPIASYRLNGAGSRGPPELGEENGTAAHARGRLQIPSPLRARALPARPASAFQGRKPTVFQPVFCLAGENGSDPRIAVTAAADKCIGIYVPLHAGV